MMSASRTPNRFILLLLGLLLIVTAAGMAAIASDASSRGWIPQIPWLPSPSDSFTAVEHPAAPGAVLASSIIVALLGLWWLIASLPRTERAGEFMLQRDGRAGVTRLGDSALRRAVEASTERIPGVVSASARLQGTADVPGLMLKVDVDERSDMAAAIDEVHQRICAEVELALEAELDQVRVIVNPVRKSMKSQQAQVKNVPWVEAS